MEDCDDLLDGLQEATKFLDSLPDGGGGTETTEEDPSLEEMKSIVVTKVVWAYALANAKKSDDDTDMFLILETALGDEKDLPTKSNDEWKLYEAAMERVKWFILTGGTSDFLRLLEQVEAAVSIDALTECVEESSMLYQRHCEQATAK